MPDCRRRAFLFRLLLLILCGGLLLLAVAEEIPCLLRRMTGLICPACGMSRAWLAALRLDLAAAFRYHPMFWSVPVLALLWLFDGKLLPRPWMNRALLTVLLTGLLVCYGIRLAAPHSFGLSG